MPSACALSLTRSLCSSLVRSFAMGEFQNLGCAVALVAFVIPRTPTATPTPWDRSRGLLTLRSARSSPPVTHMIIPPIITKGPRNSGRTMLINRLHGFHRAPVYGNVDAKTSDQFLGDLAQRGKLWTREKVVGGAPGVQGQCHANVEKLWLENPAKYRWLIGFGLFEEPVQWAMHSVAEDLERGVLFERDSLLPTTRLYFLMPAPLKNGHLAILPRL
jgi:hypothetical protein